MPEGWHRWMPTAHHGNPEILKWAKEFVEMDFNKLYDMRKNEKLFYVEGQSYEFDNDNNWELLSDLCEVLGGKEDIWYATNIDIYEYISAYYFLIYSADGRQKYNPTLQTIWLD